MFSIQRNDNGWAWDVVETATGEWFHSTHTYDAARDWIDERRDVGAWARRILEEHFYADHSTRH